MHPQIEDLYHERQREGQCGIHALNNLLGVTLFDQPSMILAGERYLEDKAADGGLQDGETLATHMRNSGWYSIEVMAFAVGSICRLFNTEEHKYAMSIAANDARAILTSADPLCCGALVNHMGHHWSAIRKFDAYLVHIATIYALILMD